MRNLLIVWTQTIGECRARAHTRTACGSRPLRPRRLRAQRGMGDVRHVAPRGSRALERGARHGLRLLGRHAVRGRMCRRQGRRDVHLDQVRQPRGGRRGPDGRPSVDPGNRRPPPPGAAQAHPAGVQCGQPASQLRGLPARPHQADRRCGAADHRLRLRQEDLRRFPDPGPGPAARRSVQRHRPADRLGQPDGRQHRPGLHRLSDHRPGQRQVQAVSVPHARLPRRLRVRPRAGEQTQGRRRRPTW